MRQGTSEDAIESFPVGHLTVGHGPTLRRNLFPQTDTNFICKWLSAGAGFWARTGTCVHFSFQFQGPPIPFLNLFSRIKTNVP